MLARSWNYYTSSVDNIKKQIVLCLVNVANHQKGNSQRLYVTYEDIPR